MDITPELIRQVAKNACLELSEKEVAAFVPQFKEIMQSFSCLDELDVSGMEAKVHAIDICDQTRDDVVEPSFPQDVALSNTSSKKDGYFKGPKAF